MSAGAQDATTGAPTALLAVTVAILVVLALRTAGRAIAPIAVVVRSLVAAGMAALMMLAAFALVLYVAMTQL
jgi:hypothetical protein